MMYQSKWFELEAIQFTMKMAVEAVQDRAPGPFGLQVYGETICGGTMLGAAWIKLANGQNVDVDDWVLHFKDGTFLSLKPNVFRQLFVDVR